LITFERFAGIFSKYLVKAASGSRDLFVLNCLVRLLIPFVRGHGLRVNKISDGATEISLAFKSSNKNHIGTMHACISATSLELAAGLSLLRAIAPTPARPVIRNLSVQYYKPGKTNLFARCVYDAEAIDRLLRLDNPASIELVSELTDSEGLLIARMVSTWSVKIYS
jgi:acyl-coenzyme A thioesterase PaaI-like protein